MKRLIGWSLATIVPAAIMWWVVSHTVGLLGAVGVLVALYLCLIGAKISLMADYEDEMNAKGEVE